MRGRRYSQATMLAFVDLEERVPKDHPLRTVKAVADGALERLSAEFDRVVHHSVILDFDVPSYRTDAAQQRGKEQEVNRQN